MAGNIDRILFLCISFLILIILILLFPDMGVGLVAAWPSLNLLVFLAFFFRQYLHTTSDWRENKMAKESKILNQESRSLEKRESFLDRRPPRPEEIILRQVDGGSDGFLTHILSIPDRLSQTLERRALAEEFKTDRLHQFLLAQLGYERLEIQYALLKLQDQLERERMSAKVEGDIKEVQELLEQIQVLRNRASVTDPDLKEILDRFIKEKLDKYSDGKGWL